MIWTRFLRRLILGLLNYHSLRDIFLLFIFWIVIFFIFIFYLMVLPNMRVTMSLLIISFNYLSAHITPLTWILDHSHLRQAFILRILKICKVDDFKRSIFVPFINFLTIPYLIALNWDYFSYAFLLLVLFNSSSTPSRPFL